MKKLWRKIRPYFMPQIVYGLVRLIGMTLRFNAEGWDRVQEMEGGRICAGWHGKTFAAATLFRGMGVWTLISMSRDGEMQNKIFSKFGFNTIRGSTGKGGAKAAAQAIRALKKGSIMAFTPDGPRGPSGIVQGGIMLMARKSGAALIPAGVAASRRWNLPTWDKYEIPKPFAKIYMIFGDPIYLAKDASEDEIEAARKRLESEIHRLEEETSALAGHSSD
jgi:lysophospholipid acyltransferase (LPLAT)-like uncharacterized protein